MPQAVIDDFEFVDINEQYSEFVIRVSLRKCQRLLQPVEEQSAVGKVSKSVVECIMGQHFFSPLTLGNVAVHDYQFVGPPFCVPDRARSRFQSAPRAVFMAYPVFHPLSLAAESPLFCRFQYSRTIVGMNLLNRGSGV